MRRRDVAALTGTAAGTDQSEAVPNDIAVSMQVRVAAPDEQFTLEELDDLPGNARRIA